MIVDFQVRSISFVCRGVYTPLSTRYIKYYKVANYFFKSKQQKAGPKNQQKVSKKATKKVAKNRQERGHKKLTKNTPKKHTAIYTTHMLIIRKNFLKHIPEPVLLLP